MKTIKAKELRLNMDKIVAGARAGESFRVTYRNRPAFTIHPDEQAVRQKSKHMPGLDAFLAAPRKPSPFDETKTIKELYHELLEEKYGK